MTFYEPQSCSLPACKRSKLPKFQTPSPTCTLGPRPLSQQAPQGQGQGHFPNRHPGPGHSNGFLWAFKAAVCQPANAPKLSKRSKPSKTRQTLQTPSQQAPQIHSNDFLEAFKAPVCQPAKAATPPKFQTPSLTGGQGHSNDFL